MLRNQIEEMIEISDQNHYSQATYTLKTILSQQAYYELKLSIAQRDEGILQVQLCRHSNKLDHILSIGYHTKGYYHLRMPEEQFQLHIMLSVTIKNLIVYFASSSNGSIQALPLETFLLD
jgi:hypothetical protein